MVIQHNLAAMNAGRQFGISNKKRDDDIEKLSSGFRINRAADDAANLSISEKMRRQIRGLTQASANCQDGVSLVQVADGALEEMHGCLQRMNELCIKAANGTLEDRDRSYIQAEINQLSAEIDRICNDTAFNEIPLFRNDEKLVKINADDYNNVSMNETLRINGKSVPYSKELDFAAIDSTNVDQLDGRSFSVLCSMGCSQTFKFSFSSSNPDSATLTNPGSNRPGINVNVNLTGRTTGAQLADAVYAQVASLNSAIIAATTSYGESMQPIPSGVSGTYIGHANALAKDGSKLIFIGMGGPSGKIKAGQLALGDRTLDIHADVEAGRYIPVTLFTINASILGVDPLNVSTRTSADSSIPAVKQAIQSISSKRTYYGGVQNRMEHSINSLDNTTENTTSAESTIRDTDMAA